MSWSERILAQLLLCFVLNMSPVSGQATTLLEPHLCERVVGRGRGVEEGINNLLMVINQLQQQQTQLKLEVTSLRREVSRMNVTAAPSGDVAVNTRLISDVSAIRTDIEAMRAETRAEVQETRAEVAETRAEVTETRAEVASVQSEVTSLRSDVISLTSNVTSNFTSLKSAVTSLRADVGSMTSEVTSLAGSVASGSVCPPMQRSGPREVWNLGQELRSEVSTQQEFRFRDCDDVWAAGRRRNGTYNLRPLNTSQSFPAYCEIHEDGGWTLIQHRFDGHVDFYRNWTDYKFGFGDISSESSREASGESFGEFWLGNENIHKLTAQATYMLSLEMEDWRGNTYTAEADRFYVDTEKNNYRLHIPQDYYSYSGRGASGLRVHAGSFSTHDRNNLFAHDNCAVTFHCGWWFTSCVTNANLNGRYYQAGYQSVGTRQRARDDLHWPNVNQSLKRTTIKVKRVNSSTNH